LYHQKRKKKTVKIAQNFSKGIYQAKTRCRPLENVADKTMLQKMLQKIFSGTL